MNGVRIALVVIAAALAGALGWITNWGQDLFADSDAARAKAAAKTDAGALLPDFKLSADSNAYAQIAERPLLNPTRRPAPTQAVAQVAPEPPKPQIRRGLYQLVGISDFGGTKLAQVKELAGGRVRTVRIGDQLQELSVKSIAKEEVVLAFQGETDVLQLAKFTASGRVPQPTPAAAPSLPPAGLPPQPMQPGQPVAQPGLAGNPPQAMPVSGVPAGAQAAIAQPAPGAAPALSAQDIANLPLLPNGQPQTRENENAFIESRRRARFARPAQ